MNAEVQIPSHVAPALVFDFDLYADQRYGEEAHTSFDAIQRQAPDVFWTPRNGGHWVVTRHEHIQEVVQDPEHFSARESRIPRVPNPPKLFPLNLDPPENVPYRQALMPAFSPKAVKALEERIRHWAKAIVDDVADKGRCDFVSDVSGVFPVSVFMELMGMDLARLSEFRHMAENFFAAAKNPHELQSAMGQIVGVMTGYIEEKRKQPDGALISLLVQAQINGRPFRLDELQNMCTLLFLGGMHTVTNMAGFAYWHLAERPELQAQLAADPKRINDFVEESIRLFGVVMPPRLIIKDCERFGASLREGEMLVCMLPMAGRDGRVNANPAEMDLDRKQREHLTFSKGPHLCVGHFLARAEIRILTEEWVRRIPSFRLAPDSRQKYSVSTVLGLESLPIVW